MHNDKTTKIKLLQIIRLALGPIIGLLILILFHPLDLPIEGTYVASVASCMAIWWATEAIPVAVTALLPLALFPLFDVGTIKNTAASYSHPIIYLFLGGFVIAIAIERSGLHLRAALKIFRFAGIRGKALVAGFMLAGAFMSMWIKVVLLVWTG